MALPLTNRLLDSLPAAVKAQLLAGFEPVSLPLNTAISEPGKPPKYVHFITSGIASVVTTMKGGDAVEVGLAGREGFPEALHLLGPALGHTRGIIQVGGTGLRMEFKKFQREFQQNPVLNERVLWYVQYEALVMAQLAACNRLHEVEERLARWLLMVADRTGSLTMQLTQEFLGEMLGARRSTVTIAAGTLQRGGMIDYHRGHVAIINRDRLEETACECYPITCKLFSELYR